MAFDFDKMSINGTVINAKDLEGRDLIAALDLTAQNAKETAENAAETANQAMIDTAAQDGRIDTIEGMLPNFVTKTDFPRFIAETTETSGASNNLSFDIRNYMTEQGQYMIATRGALAYIKYRGSSPAVLLPYGGSESTATILSDSTITIYTGGYYLHAKIYQIA